ncbi:PQ-loop-domain-containing protein [Polychaeton citri CBS 116435]|uniref:PQ-loop-domain-containing protein n=1 Tax=Polychaeton citri CBS 116435 TaxID=1314669 RepID=A0A9P4ULE7_9PEZI|nr:PQ-loop-domain-containing protein [Polychaeton citri CBS 116435]
MLSLHSIPLTWNEALSGITGSISLASWIFLLLPQLYENYAQSSADGISLTFLLIWFVGDVTNLAGALWAGLVPTVIALAIYFCFADTVLIGQVLYYKAKNAREKKREDGETAPLLANGQADPAVAASKNRAPRRSFGDVTDENLGLPGSRRRSSAGSSHNRPRNASATSERLAVVAEESSATPSSSMATAWLKNTLSILAIIAAGAGGWAIAWKTGAWRPTPVGQDAGSDDSSPVGAEVLGYISAICYLGARIPQIVKNQRERSCEGLSLLFFLLSLLGNATYGAGILFHSVEKQYFLTNLPWLIGSLGTMAEDAIIFVQFHTFGENKKSDDDNTHAIEDA